jgi:hypothetical protein
MTSAPMLMLFTKTQVRKIESLITIIVCEEICVGNGLNGDIKSFTINSVALSL